MRVRIFRENTFNMAGNSARTIEKHYYKNTKQEELRQRMNAHYRSWDNNSIENHKYTLQ